MAESKKKLYLCSSRIGTVDCAGVQLILEYSAEMQCLACDLSKYKLNKEQIEKVQEMVKRSTRVELREA